VRGGVGASTIAVNLAVQLADRSRHHIVLLDADLHSGAAALMLSASAGGGLRVALENPERVDVLFAERSAAAVSDRLHILAAEEPLDTLIAHSEGAARHLTSLLCNRFNFAVVDLPRHVTPLNQELRELAHVRVLVMDATLPSLRDALRHLNLPRGAHQASRPIVVLNHLGAPGSLTRKQIVEGLGTDVDVIVPWLPKLLQSAATLGQPAVRRRGAFQTAIGQLANELLPQRAEPAKSWLGLLRRAGKARA
jgi:pilus assembly protein CpaE